MRSTSTPGEMAATSDKIQRYSIGDLELDIGRLRVTRSELEIALPRLSFDLLLTLVRHAPDVLTHDQLMDEVWPDVVINHDTVLHRVKLLRDALGDDSRSPRYIGLARGRGYRLLPPVTPIEPASSKPPAAAQPASRGTRRFLWPILVLGAIAVLVAMTLLPATEPDKSIAVIPFASHGSDAESGIFAAGIHDDLVTQLAKIADLKVISRTSVMEYANTTKSMRKIGEELRVKHVLEGGVQKSGKRVRINAQLIDAETDEHMWAETFDRELTTENIFEIQSEIAHRIADALHVTLAPETVDAIAKVSTDSIEAYRDYMAAISMLSDLDKRIFGGPGQSAADLFRSAVEHDPQFALAWVRLADALQKIAWFDPNRRDAIEDAVTALQRAEEIDPNLPEIHLVRAQVQYRGYLNNEEALRELALAERGLPGNAEIFLTRAYIFRRMDRMPEALTNFERALQLDPRNQAAIRWYGRALVRVRRFDDARALSERAITEFPNTFSFRMGSAELDGFQRGDFDAFKRTWLRPDTPRIEGYELAAAYYAWVAGDLQTAQVHARQITVNELSDREHFVTAEEVKGAILEGVGKAEEAGQLYAAALARMEQIVADNPDDPIRRQALARLHAFVGNYAQAIRIANDGLATFGQQDDLPFYETFRETHGVILCHAGDFDGAEAAFRWMLSRVNERTLAYLVNSWPPCKTAFVGSENFRRLEEEFGHLSLGVAGPRE